MNLSTEDQLRLNVLLAHELHAVRIDEAAMTVQALSTDGEARVTLSPHGRAGQYLKRVRELLSTHALGSPGGYPVFLQRWTRMGQHREGQLDKLLLLGEPEAVVAVAGAAGLTPELARRVWWLMPEADIARRMLERDSVADSDVGREMAKYLVEHLAFEEDPMTAITSIRLVLKPGLVAPEMIHKIWARAQHRMTFYKLGFLEACPDDLPMQDMEPADIDGTLLGTFAESGNLLARQLQRSFARGGQAYLKTAEELLQHPTDKFTAAAMFNNIGKYFSGIRHLTDPSTTAEELLAAPGDFPRRTIPEVTELVEADASLQPAISAALALSRVDENLATPILAQTSASGTLLRRKLEPVTNLVLPALAALRDRRQKHPG